MATRLNRYYNNPEIGAAISNLASIFEPPAPTDVLAYAQAAKVRQEQEGLADLYGLAGDPNADLDLFDRRAAALGVYNPTSGFGARDQADATARYGIGVASGDRRYGVDVGAATARANNAADNARALEATRLSTQGGLVGDLFGPLSQGQVRPAVPDDIMGVFDLPGVDPAAGAPKPLSETEAEGQLLLDAIEQGMVTPEDAARGYRSDIPVEEIVGPDGQPQIVNRADAVGQAPYTAPGSAPARKFVTYKTPDGRMGTAVLDPQASTMVDQATGQPLPAGTITGEVTDAGGGALTTGTMGDFQKRAFALTGAISTIDSLTDLVRTSPSSQGLVGSIRGTAQDIMQTGNELGRAFGSTMAEVNNAVAQGLVDAGVATQMYDPNIPAIDMLMNVLAWQYAKSMSGDRVSNEMLRAARAAIGETGAFANQASTLTRLGQLRGMLTEEGSRLLPNLEGPVRSDLDVRLRAPGAPPGDFTNTGARPRAVNPQTGEAVEWDGQAWVPAQ